MRAELSRLIGVSILALSISKIVVSVDGFKEGFEGGDRRLGSDKNRALGAKRLRARSAALGSSWMRVGGGGEWEVIIMEQKEVRMETGTYIHTLKQGSIDYSRSCWLYALGFFSESSRPARSILHSQDGTSRRHILARSVPPLCLHHSPPVQNAGISSLCLKTSPIMLSLVYHMIPTPSLSTFPS